MWTSVAVFCGSRHGKNPMYAKHTQAIGLIIAQYNIQLIYGGGKNGLMGIIADAVLNNGGKAIGVLPALLSEKEHRHDSLTTLHVVETMHERKKMMYDLSDAAIILPGGYGTLDELFEMITWNQLHIHNKKIVLMNTDGYYNQLVAHLEKMQSEDFLYSDWKESLVIIEDPQALASLMDEDIHQNRRV